MLLRRLLTVLAAATATVAVSSPAHADFYYWQESGGAQVRFYPDSNVMKICDVGYDHHPVAEWYTQSQNFHHRKHAYPGQGRCGAPFVPAGVIEGQWISFRACEFEGSSQLSCSPFEVRYA